jgi:Ca-activated chloride channel family protein
MLSLIALLPAIAALLAPQAQSAQRFTSRSDLVVLPVAVIDRKSGFVTDLPREAFTVYDNGKPQSITFFESTARPVTVGLLIDSSISMSRRRSAVVAAGNTFADTCRADDEMFTINFNERVWPGLPDGVDFTSEPGELKLAIARSGARGQTALFDALGAGLRHLALGRHQQRALIVVSDGGDNASRIKAPEVLDAAMRMNVVIYTISIDDVDQSEANPDLLRKLAASTGGEAFFLRKLSAVAPTLERISRDIRQAYIIGYVPSEPPRDSELHSIRVEVKSPDRQKLVVRSRSGYVAAGTGQ